MNNTNSIDNDWMNFVQCNYDTNILNTNNTNTNNTNTNNTNTNNTNTNTNDIINNRKKNPPKSSELYISTKTKISYLSKTINLKQYFWNIPITPYEIQEEGIIKKQMKFNSDNKEDLNEIIENIEKYKKQNVNVDEHIINSIDNPEGRIKFKDVRKISIGITKKDLVSYRCKKKSAFYNCFVVIIRIKNNNEIFKDYHVKVFNTGKLEIPGIQENNTLSKILDILTKILNSLNIETEKITYSKESETVLINSNFNCGFLINRDKMYDLLKNKYNINSSYDPCSYPGIQCNFFYDLSLDKQSGIQPATDKSKSNKSDMKKEKNVSKTIFKISFMIFRTGSVLIVGRCNENMINDIYLFIKDILFEEYESINVNNELINKKTSKKHHIIKKKKIQISTKYFINNIKINNN